MQFAGDNESILIVDDDVISIELLISALQDKFAIKVAASGQAAIDIVASQFPPSIILLDIMMDHMDGYEVLQKLKNSITDFNIPVIFLTERNTTEDETKGLELGAVDYIFKPFCLASLSAKIKNHLDLVRQRNFIKSLAAEQHKVIVNSSRDFAKKSERQEVAIKQHLDTIKQNEFRLRLALAASHMELWDWDMVTGKFIRSTQDNPLLLPTMGLVTDFDLLFSHVYEKDRSKVTLKLQQHLSGETEHFSAEYRIQSPNESGVNKWLWVHDIGKIIKTDAVENPVRMIGTIKDIGHRKVAEEKLSLLAKTYENTSDGVWIADSDWQVKMVNQSFATITGYSEEDVIDKRITVAPFYKKKRAFEYQLKQSLTQSGHWSSELADTKKNGDSYIQELNVYCIVNDSGDVSHYVGVFSDITMRKRTEYELRKLTNNDALTGLPNKTFFNQYVETRISSSKAKGDLLAVLLIDLDNFKNINDSLGHALGDELLRKIAFRLNTFKRPKETLARVGGDEFCLLIESADSVNTVASIAQGLLEEIQHTIVLNEHEIIVTASIGITIFPSDMQNDSSLMSNADTAMYAAKNKGRNCYQFFTSTMNKEAVEHLQLESDLRKAIENHELIVFYQPKMNSRTEQCIGAEALVRWQSPERGLVGPNQFIPLAEETSLIIPLGEYVLREACLQQKAWVDSGLTSGRVAVNLSVKQFKQVNLISRIEQIIKETGLNPRYLELEITESSIIEDLEQAISIMEEIRALGIHLAIDDFGTGYSSLSYLKRFPVNTLKIDRSFVTDMMSSEEDSKIVESIIGLGHCLGLQVIAEGVETKEQADILRSLNTDYFQGFYYSKPVAAEMFESDVLRRNIPLRGAN
ncbi:MAG: EAL domain-containing protein [Pseudomonadales bacterium]|nr:EAL domain-containing protein [Pseudomonadales bacterium]